MKFINQFQHLEKTKKVVILFITISFVFILGCTSYNALTHNFNNDHIINTEDKVKENKKVDKNSQEQKAAEEQSMQTVDKNIENDKTEKLNQKTEKKETQTNTVDHSSKSQQTHKENTNQQNSSSSQVSTQPAPAKEMITVYVEVIGMGDTMMSGNLTVEKESNAYSVLKELASENGKMVSGSTTYVTGIGNLKEKEHGANSGWMYKVNGNTPHKPAVAYTLQQGDSVTWFYVNYE